MKGKDLKMKKVFLWLLVISMIAGFYLTGCKEEAAAAEVKLEVLMPSYDYTEGMKARFAAIEEKLGIKTEVEVVDAAIMYNLIGARLASGEMPDILDYDPGALLYALNPVENFVDISDQPFVANLATDFKKAASVDGKLFGIATKSAMVGGIMYNKNIYKELGLEIPKTWAELMDNSEKIKAAGYTAFLGTFIAEASWTSQIIFLADYYNVNALYPEFADDYTANKAHCADTPVVLRSFEKLEELHSRGLINEDCAALTYEDGHRLLSEGKVAHYPVLSNTFHRMSANYPEAMEFLGIFPVPSDDPNINGFTSWEPNAFYVTKSCKDVESAMRWMEFMTSQEAVDVDAAVEKLSGPLLFTDLTLPSNIHPVVFEIQKYFNEGKSWPALEFLSPIKGPNFPGICVEVAMGIKTALQGAQAYDVDVKAQAQQLGLEGW